MFINTLFNIKEFIFPNTYNLFISKFIKREDLKIKNSIDSKPTEINKETIISEFRKSLELFVKICQTYDIEPILISQYSRYNLIDDEITNLHLNNLFRLKLISEMHPLFNKVIEDVAFKMKVYYINLSSQIPNTKEFIYDDVHLNKKGNTLAAKLISEYFYNNIHKSLKPESTQ